MRKDLSRLTHSLEADRARRPRSPAPPPSVDESEMNPAFSLLEHWKTLHTHRRLVTTAAAAGLALALLWSAVIVRTYRAAATIRIDRERPLLENIAEQEFPVFPEQADYIETQYKILRSRTLAKQVIAKLDLDGRKELRHGLAEDEIAAYPGDVHPTILERFFERLSVTPSKGTRLVEVAYASTDPQLAPRVANELSDSFVEYNLRAKWDAVRNASVWLEEQLAGLEARLQASEAALREYAQKHSILFVEERKDLTTEKLAQIEDELTRAQADRISKQSSALLAEDVVQGDGELPGSLSSETYSELQQQLADLRREYAGLLVSFAPGYPAAQRVSRQIDELAKALHGEKERLLSSLREQYAVAAQREELLRAAAAQQRAKVNDISTDFIQYDILKRDAETNRQLYEGLLQRLKEAGVAAGLRASNIAVLDPAEVPNRPYRPRVALNALVGLAAGLFAGVALAFAREHFDSAVRTPEQVERLLGLNLLAVVPRSRKPQTRKLATAAAEDQAVRLWAPEDGLAEAYRSLRSSVLLGWDASMRRILLTSSQPQEGKTTLSLNLSCSLAQLGREVVLIDGDMRRPDCHRHLSIEPRPGLSEFLRGEAEVDEILHATPVPGLSLIPAGRSTTSASDLLHSPRLADLLEAIAERFQHVVVDSPPALALSDARTLGRLVEAVVLVVSDRTNQRSLMRTKRNFDDAGVEMLGFVMNRVGLDHVDYGYYRDYGYYSSSASAEKEQPAA